MLTQPIRELLDDVAQNQAVSSHGSLGAIVEINQVVSAAASLYEKVRYLIDYREEHTIRRAAIERILKRHILIEKKQVDGTALLQELVEGQYISKDAAIDDLLKSVDHTIQKFLQVQVLSGKTRDLAKKLLSLAASEIESTLSHRDYVIDRASVDALYKVVRPHILLTGFSDEEIDAQVFCGARRALLSSDDASLSYALWLMYVPEWKNEDVDLESVAARAKVIIEGIQQAVAHPLQWQIAQRMKNESIYFRIIRECVIEEGSSAQSILGDPNKLDAYTRNFLDKKYEKENERIRSSGIRAVIYLFFTKMTVALIVEAPYEIFILGGINYVPLLTNLLFHPLFLFALTRRVGALGEGNTKAIIDGLHHVLYDGNGRALRIYARYTRFTRMFATLYGILVIGIFGFIVTILQLLEFNVIGTALFLFFLALVSYFAYRIRSNARRWKVTGQESTISLIANMLAVPIVRVGRWLSHKFSSINIFVVIMDFIIETPFRQLLNFSHQFILYVKEKADEVY